MEGSSLPGPFATRIPTSFLPQGGLFWFPQILVAIRACPRSGQPSKIRFLAFSTWARIAALAASLSRALIASKMS